MLLPVFSFSLNDFVFLLPMKLSQVLFFVRVNKLRPLKRVFSGECSGDLGFAFLIGCSVYFFIFKKNCSCFSMCKATVAENFKLVSHQFLQH